MKPSPRATQRARTSVVPAVLALVALFLGSLTVGAPAQAQQSSGAALQRQVRADLAGPDGKGKDGPLAKVSGDLVRLYRRHERYVQQGRVGTFSSGGLARVQPGGYVAVDAIATEGNAQQLRADLEALGLKHSAVSGPLVGGSLPIEAIGDAARLGTLRFARSPVPALNVGAVTSQGVAAMRADVAREDYGVDGTGATIGVLSDSYDCVGGAADDVTGGDLPGAGQLRVLREEPGCVSGTDEGRAMLQIVYDVAPGANFLYHTAFDTEASFAEGIRLLAEEGAGIIVDDIIYLNEPMFQDGQVTQAVDEGFAEGAAYFSSAGNNGNFSYESAFRDSGEPGVISPDNEGSTMHDFDPGPEVDLFQTITVPVTTGDTTVPSVQFSVQWDQPYASAGGPGAPTDIDVALFTMDGTLIETAVGGADNNGEGAGSRNDPVEVFGFVNGGNYDSDDDGTPDTQFQLAIERFDGPAPDLIKYVVFENAGVTVDEYFEGGPTAFGHANAAGALSIGAASYFNTAVFNENVLPAPALVNDFSALGGVPILFDVDGTRLDAPLVRQKPEIVAPNGVNTTFFGADLPADFDDFGDDDTFPNFFGTSAAAPHAAGVAALMRSRNRQLAPRALYDLLIATAADMDDDPVNESDGTFAEGFDFKTGFGFIQADQAVREVPNDLIRFDAALASGGVTDAVDLTWTFAADAGVDSVFVQRREIDQGGAYVGLRAAQGEASTFETIEALAVTNAGEPFPFPVENLNPGVYEFRLRYVKEEGGERVSALSFIRSVTLELQADDFQLMGPYPNPTRRRAHFDLVVAREQVVEVSVFNILGQRIPSQAEEGQTVEGSLRKTYTFDTDRLAPGVYFVRFTGETFTETRRLVVVR